MSRCLETKEHSRFSVLVEVYSLVGYDQWGHKESDTTEAT